MTFEKGLAIIEATDTETKGFFIDQDALECARLNAKTRKRLEEMEAKQREAEAKHQKAVKDRAKAKAKRKAYTLKAAAYIVSNCAICGAVAWAGIAGMIHPIISFPVSILCLCAACVRFGAWFGKVVQGCKN